MNRRKNRTRTAVVAFALVATLTPLAVAQENTTTPASEEDEESEVTEKIQIVGSRIKRTDYEGPSPITVLGRDRIDASGKTNLTELLRELPEASAIGINEGGTISAVRGATALDLRQLGANNTLVVVDGRRVQLTGSNSGGTTFVDLNRFPLAMIERIEVLKDGASAIYGADATAGVVNIVMRKDFVGSEMNLSYGQSQKGDGSEFTFSAFGGAAMGKARANVGISYFKRGEVQAKDRWFSSNADLTERYRARGGYYADEADAGSWDLRSGTGPQARISLPTAAQLQANGIGQFFTENGVQVYGQVNPLLSGGEAGQVRATRLPGTGGTNAGTLTSATPPFTGNAGRPSASQFVPQILTPGSNPSNLYNYQEFVWLVPSAERKAVFANVGYDFTDMIEGYMKVSYSRNESQIRLAPSPISTAGDNNILVPASNYYNPFGVAVAFNYRPTQIGPRIADQVGNSYEVLGGLRGTFLDKFDWDMAYSYGYDEARDTTTNAMSESLLKRALARTDAGALNVFGGPNFVNDPATIESIRVKTFKGGSADLINFDGSVTTDELFTLPTGSVGAALHLEYRKEGFSESNDDLSVKLDDIIGQVRLADPTDTSRSVKAAATEFRVPLMEEGRVPFVHTLEASLAARFEDFSDGYDSGIRPFVGLKYRPFKWLLVRGSYGENFRAPTLPQLYGGVRESLPNNLADWARPQTLTGDPFDGAATQRLVRQGGNPNLTPEEAETRQIGFVLEVPWKKLEGLSLEATYGTIEQENVITTTGTTYLRNNEFGEAAGLIVRDTQTETYTNTTANPITVYVGPGPRTDSAANRVVAPGASITVPGRIRYYLDTYVNLAYQRVKYYDFGVRYSKKFDDLGNFRVSTQWTHLDSYTYTRTPEAGLPEYAGTDAIIALPEWRGQSSLDWERKSWNAGANVTYIHGYGSLDIDGYEVASYHTVGAYVGYQFEAGSMLGKSRLTFGIDNLLDRDPPLYYDGVGYDQSMIGRPQGRFFFMSIRTNF